MKKTMWTKRIVALLLAMAMALSLLVVGMWANEDDSNEAEPEISAQAEQEQEPEESEEADDECAGEDAEGDLANEANEANDADDADDADGVDGVDGADDDDEADGNTKVDDSAGVEADTSVEVSLAVQDDEYDDGDEIEQPVSEAPATPAPDFSADGDWRLPSDASEIYLKCAQAIIDGKETPDFDVHFECDGVTIDYIYNGDGTYTLSTAGDMGDQDAANKTERRFYKKYKHNVGDSSYNRFGHGTCAEFEWLRINANRSTPELQARYEEMVAFYDAVEDFIETRFKVTKIYCDSTMSKTKTYLPNLSYKKKSSVTYDGVSVVLAPLNHCEGVIPLYDYSYDEPYFAARDWQDSVVEFTYGPSVKTACGLADCANLTKFSWGKSKVTNILDGMFTSCPKLKEIRIPATVKLIGNYVMEDKTHYGRDGEYGNICSNVPSGRTIVFEGDIAIGTDSCIANGFTEGVDKVVAMGDLSIRNGASLATKTLDVKGNLYLDDMNPGMNSTYMRTRQSVLALICASKISVGGDAYMCGGALCSFMTHMDRYNGLYREAGPIELVTVNGNVIFDNTKTKNKYGFVCWGSDGSIGGVKKLVVGKNLLVRHRGILPPFGSDLWGCLGTVVVNGEVKYSASDPKWVLEEINYGELYYPIKSHGTTTAKEAKANMDYMPVLADAKSGKKQLVTAKWRKAKKGIGYQVQVSTDKNFKDSVKTVKVSGLKKTSVTIAKLKSKKKYYVRIRTIKKSGSYSAWSSVKTVSVK